MNEKVFGGSACRPLYSASPDPDPLFAVLAEIVRLPVGWPMDDFTGARSGGVRRGETAIEVIILAAQARLPRGERRPAQLPIEVA